jgi:hypothetical protein
MKTYDHRPYLTQSEAATKRRAKSFIAILEHKRQFVDINMFAHSRQQAIDSAKRMWESDECRLVEVYYSCVISYAKYSPRFIPVALPIEATRYFIQQWKKGW